MLEMLPGVLGHALSDVRAGLDKTLFQNSGLRAGMASLTLGSLAFGDHAPIPARYTADGDGISPPLHWSGVPANATALALIVEDADSPTPQPLVHALLVDLPATDAALPEAALQEADDRGPADGTLGRNSMLQTGWLPPDPPPGHGVHRYVFQLYALGPGDALGSIGRDALRHAVAERAIASGCLIGTYERPDGSVPVAGAQTAAV